mmetsp:Transcript_21117/g.45611  ORF Transcript_21117/g.45611 Transcript_21117/m.45611 type:complete len:83 (+) Transcript_21117:1724-1972(+)
MCKTLRRGLFNCHERDISMKRRLLIVDIRLRGSSHHILLDCEGKMPGLQAKQNEVALDSGRSRYLNSARMLRASFSGACVNR